MSKKRITNRYVTPVPIHTAKGRRIISPAQTIEVDVKDEQVHEAQSKAMHMLTVEDVPKPKPKKPSKSKKKKNSKTDSNKEGKN